ncbi:MAG: GHKL domain-containing protein [Lachnospiraceae bacterium]|nr:GHKL domain-containing protein [Lachnospiraceae bacterium]
MAFHRWRIWRPAGRKQASQRAMMEKYCDEVENMYRQMRVWRHNYKNHLQVMKAHLDMGEYQELSDYITHLNQELTQIEQMIRTGNVMLDAILNSKISLARTRGIEVNAKVVLPQKLSVTEYDLCVILGNLLDNAIEGCESQAEGETRFMRIYIGVLKEQLYLSVTNSHSIKIRKENGRYRSTKAADRGLGVLSIDHIVSGYKGYVNRQNDDAVFATEVLLPL